MSESYTKKIVRFITLNAVGWVWCSYILAFMGRYEIAQALSQTAITTLLGTVITYCLKSLVENVNKHGVNLAPKTENQNNTNTAIKRDY